MLRDPVQLIDQAISELEDLSVLFADEIDTRIHGVTQLSREGRIYKRAHESISVLLPQLRAARQLQQPEQFLHARTHRPFCVDCE